MTGVYIGIGLFCIALFIIQTVLKIVNFLYRKHYNRNNNKRFGYYKGFGNAVKKLDYV